jgi:hypothetical protein
MYVECNTMVSSRNRYCSVQATIHFACFQLISQKERFARKDYWA